MSPDLQLQSVEYLIFNWNIIRFNWGPQVGILKVTTKKSYLIMKTEYIETFKDSHVIPIVLKYW